MDEHRERTTHNGSDHGRDDAAHGDARARVRLEALFEGFDRLTPDELARIGLRRDHGQARRSQLDAVEAAAAAHGRTALLEEARTSARDTVLNRYSAGGLHPTWVGLNWGLSQGRIEDRVAIVEALEDAAAVAVVADVVDPDVADALSLDAEHLVGLAAGEANEGALSRAVEPPPAGYHDTAGRKVAVGTGAFAVAMAGLAVSLVATGIGVTLEASIGLGVASGVVAAGIVFALARR
jgi:hypothetical protein